MKIAVLSDSHIGQRITGFPPGFIQQLHDFDAIIHCGDFTSPLAVEQLREAANFNAVAGNMDESIIKRQLPDTLAVELEGFNIGITHGWGAPNKLEFRVLEALKTKYPHQQFNIILFGHSHKPLDKTIDGVRMINPGSFSGNNFSSYGSWGILTLSEGNINFELKQIEV